MRKDAAKIDSLLDTLEQSLAQAARHQPGVEEPPAAILWADPKSEWQPIIRPLRERLCGWFRSSNAITTWSS